MHWSSQLTWMSRRTSEALLSRMSDTALHQRSEKSTKTGFPWWLPISLLAVTTAALAVPIFLLQRRRVTLANSLLDSSAPPRRSGQTPAQFSRALRGPRSEPILVSEKVPRDSVVDGADGDFNSVLYAAKALGIATLLVGVGSAATVWGLKSTLGIQDTKDFADRMRHTIRSHAPVLSSRIHRPLDRTEDDHPASDSQDMNWSWPAAEARLKKAFDSEGWEGWADAAIREVEAEARMERMKRESMDRRNKT